MSENNKAEQPENERMPDEWVSTDEDDGHTKPDGPIESEFRPGHERVRNSNGKWRSLSMAIMKTNDYLNDLSAVEVAEQFEVSEEVAREHLDWLRKNYGPNESTSPDDIRETHEIGTEFDIDDDGNY